MSAALSIIALNANMLYRSQLKAIIQSTLDEYGSVLTICLVNPKQKEKIAEISACPTQNYCVVIDGSSNVERSIGEVQQLFQSVNPPFSVVVSYPHVDKSVPELFKATLEEKCRCVPRSKFQSVFRSLLIETMGLSKTV